MKVLVTGGAGFIGTSVVRYLLGKCGASVVNVDKLTYAGSNPPLGELARPNRYCLEIADITDRERIRQIFNAHQPDAVMHLAAETHVDRSIDNPQEFIQTNLVGTFVMLEAARYYWQRLAPQAKENFRFHHISSDEVFGSSEFGCFTEETRYDPTSPYSASKAGADHLVRAWHRTYGLPVIISNSSNNFGPWQFPEKLIPLTILNALEGQDLPIYGTGKNVRDWLYVEDHAHALVTIMLRGRVGEVYNIGGSAELSNIEVVRKICAIIDIERKESPYRPHENLIRFVSDRPGHDLRYAIDDSKSRRELNWQPQTSLTNGLRKTVRWYIENKWWWEPIRRGVYQGERLGLVPEVHQDPVI